MVKIIYFLCLSIRTYWPRNIKSLIWDSCTESLRLWKEYNSFSVLQAVDLLNKNKPRCFRVEHHFSSFAAFDQGTLYPYRKCNHVNILGFFTCHEKEAKFFHVHAKIEVFTFHGKIKIIFTDKYFNILLPILTVIDTRNVALQGSLFGMNSQHCL